MKLSFGLLPHVCVYVIVSAMPVHAASLYWDGASNGPDADGGVGTWSTAATTNWATAATGGSNVAWTDGSDAVFGSTGGVVTVSGTVAANSLTFDSQSYRITGGQISLNNVPVIGIGSNDVTLESVITGTLPISKTGTGTLTLSGENSFTKALTISAGTVKAGNPAAFGISGTVASGTTISSGATLDINGQNLGSERFTVSGTGVGGAGAIVNTGPTSLYAIQSLTLAGPTTIGGPGHWYFTSGSGVILSGHTLTKIGANDVVLSTNLNPGSGSGGQIDIKEGAFWFTGESKIFGTSANAVTVRTGAMFGLAGDLNPRSWTAVFEPGSTWQASLGNIVRWEGPVTVAGATTFDSQVDTAMILEGAISGSGSVTKAGPGTWYLRGTNTYTGGTTVNAGTLTLSPANGVVLGVGSLRGPVTVNQGATLTLSQSDVLGTAAGARVNPLNIAGGLVDTLAEGSHNVPVINLTGGFLYPNGGLNDLAAKSFFTLGDGAVINVLAAATPSVIAGRLHLGPGNAGETSILNIADGAAMEDLRISAAITGADATYGISKRGLGVLSLRGPAVYTGATVVEEGTLLLDGPSGQLEDSPVIVAGGARFGAMVPGKSVASITAQSGSSLVLPALTGQTTVVEGALNLSGGNVMICPLIGADTPAGTYDLLVAGSITGTGTPVLDLSGAFGASRATGSVVVNGNKLQLILTGTGSGLTWNNASAAGAANGSWDLALANFSDGAGDDTFHAFDSVTFNDSVAPGSAKTIALGATLAPAQVTVDNSDDDYTFSAPGRLVGVGSLVKTGTGTLTVAGANTYGMSGPITAGGGVLDFAGKSIATSSLVLKSGAALNNTAITTNGTLVSASITAGTVELQSGSSNARLVCSGPWTKTTPGTVALTMGNSLSGPGSVIAGHLAVGDVTTRDGSIGNGPVVISSGAAVTISRGGPNNNPSFTIFNSFSGSGSLNFIGPADPANGSFTVPLRGDSSALTGPVSATNATLSVRATGQLGSGPISLTGRGGLWATDATLPNAISLTAVGTTSGSLTLSDSSLTGSITLPAGVTTTIYSYTTQKSNFISGPIGESGSSANVVLNASLDFPMTLSGASNYTGTTHISGGVNLTGSLGATAVTVNGMAVLAGNGTIGTGGSLTFANNGILKAGTSGGGLTVRGDVTLGAITKIGVDVWPDAVASGPIPVLNYTGTLNGGVANLAMDVPSFYRKAEFAVAPGLITLDIGSKALVWKGTNSTWDSTTVKNWGTTDAGAATDFFFRGDGVVFNDSGPGGSVSWGGQNVEPSSVVVDNNTKNYTINIPISGACPVIKRGTGSLALSGSDTYTGGTTVEAGRLQITGSRPLGYGPVSIAAAGTLAGDGVIKGSVTLSGTLDPGLSSDSLPRTLSTGPTVLSGTYLCQLDTSSSDKLAVTGNLDLTGSTLTLNKTAASLTPATWVICSYTGTLTGSFTAIHGMPAGYGLKYDTAGKQILITRVNYTDWIAGFPGLSDTTDSGDPDGDGVQNLVEYVVGGNPGASDSTILPTQTIEGDKLVFRYKRNDSSVSTTTQTVQWSPDMVTWTDIAIPESSSIPVIITQNEDQPDDVKVSITRLPGSMYVRLKVVQP